MRWIPILAIVLAIVGCDQATKPHRPKPPPPESMASFVFETGNWSIGERAVWQFAWRNVAATAYIDFDRIGSTGYITRFDFNKAVDEGWELIDGGTFSPPDSARVIDLMGLELSSIDTLKAIVDSTASNQGWVVFHTAYIDVNGGVDRSVIGVLLDKCIASDVAILTISDALEAIERRDRQ